GIIHAPVCDEGTLRPGVLWNEPPMRKEMLSCVATALVGAGSALAQYHSYLPSDGPAPASSPRSMPVLLSADPAPPPPPDKGSTAPPTSSGGSTGLVPGVDCLPPAVPDHDKIWVEVSYLLP